MKNISKRSPVLECNKCGKMVHGTTTCSELTNKQIAAVRATENIEWTCQDCHNSSLKRSSFFTPNNYDIDNDAIPHDSPSLAMNMKYILKELTKEMEKAIQREMKDFIKSLQYQSDKMDEIVESIDFCKQTIQELKRKNTELLNKNSNLETRISALEQIQRESEQNKINDQLEIFNIPNIEIEETKLIVEDIATKLKMPIDDIIQVKLKRKTKQNDLPGTVQLKMKNEETVQKWLYASKSNKILLKELVTKEHKISSNKTVFMKESLTPYNKKLLWNAKEKLKETYKFIWCKKGVIRVRKNNDSHPIILRSLEDINKLI